MPIKKYINTAEVAMLTGLQQDDIRNLAKTNVLPSHRNRRGHYRFNVDAVEKYFGIVINNIEQETGPSALTANSSKAKEENRQRYNNKVSRKGFK